MDPLAAAQIAQRMSDARTPICIHVTQRLLHTFPDIVGTLRTEAQSSVEARLSAVAVERFYELMRAVLLFGMPELADQEIGWAGGVLPRSGVTYEHQTTMVTFFFEALRQYDLTLAEITVIAELEHYVLDAVNRAFHETSAEP